MERYPHLTAFLAFYQQHLNAARRTIVCYEGWVKNFYDWLLNSTGFSDPAKVTEDSIKKYRDFMQDTGYRAKTIEAKLAAVKSYFQYLVDMDIISDSPIPNYLSIRGKEKLQPVVVTPMEIFRMRLKGHVRLEHAFFFELGLSTGMRSDEIFQTRACDLRYGDRPHDKELDRPSPCFVGSITLGSGTHTTKNKSPRKVYYSHICNKLAEELFSKHNIDPTSTTPLYPWSPSNFGQWLASLSEGIVERYPGQAPGIDIAVPRERGFTDVDVDSLQVSDDFKKLIAKRQEKEESLGPVQRKASQPDKLRPRVMYPHCLRHTFANFMYYRNVFGERNEEQHLRMLMGHSDISSMMIYLRNLDYIKSDQTWRRVWLGKPEDWMGIDR